MTSPHHVAGHDTLSMLRSANPGPRWRFRAAVAVSLCLCALLVSVNHLVVAPWGRGRPQPGATTHAHPTSPTVRNAHPAGQAIRLEEGALRRGSERRLVAAAAATTMAQSCGYVTLACDAGSAHPSLVWAKSVRDTGSTADVVLLCVEDACDALRAALRAVGDDVGGGGGAVAWTQRVMVRPIRPEHEVKNPNSMSKMGMLTRKDCRWVGVWVPVAIPGCTSLSHLRARFVLVL